MPNTKTVLMCPPDHFDIEYEINPWMHAHIQPDKQLARLQWQRLRDAYIEQMGWKVEQITPVEGLPDMVFATDNCLVLGGKVMLSSFRHQQRRGETKHYAKWLHEHGYTQQKTPGYFLEGGDILVFGDKIIAGWGFRTELEAHRELQDYFGREVISLKIVDPYFYHLDTALMVLNDHTVVVYAGAIDEASQERLRQVVPNLIEASLNEAKSFGLNAISDGRAVIYSDHSETLAQKYRDAGLEIIGVDVSEFQKAGGGVNCLTLELR